MPTFKLPTRAALAHARAVRPTLLAGLGLALLLPMARADEVKKFDGTSATTTPLFTVSDSWEIVWECPMPVRITVLTPDGKVVAGMAGLFHGSFYQPKGGTYYLQIEGAQDGALSPWHISVEAGTVADANTSSLPGGVPGHFTARPPAPSPPVAGTNVADVSAVPPAPELSGTVTGSVAPTNAPPPITLTEDQLRAVVMIEGDNAEGTGFFVKMPDGPAVVTNLHVLANNPNVRILTDTGALVPTLGLKGASDRDLALLPVKDDGYSYLDLDSAIATNVAPDDDVITPGNSEGGEVTLNTHGTVVAVGPDRVEITNPVYHGNSGGPVFDTKTGSVIAVVTQAIPVNMSSLLDRASFASRDSAITTAMRYFGLRLDTVAKWETYDPRQYQLETAFLERFHQQNRRLDSYLNSYHRHEDDDAPEETEGGTPFSQLYLTDDKIVKAHADFMNQIRGADAGQRDDAVRSWLFSLDGIADTDMTAIRNMSNFYSFDQIRAQEEIDYRQALRQALDYLGEDPSRAERLGRQMR